VGRGELRGQAGHAREERGTPVSGEGGRAGGAGAGDALGRQTGEGGMERERPERERERERGMEGERARARERERRWRGWGGADSAERFRPAWGEPVTCERRRRAG